MLLRMVCNLNVVARLKGNKMPLIKGYSKKSISKNIAMEHKLHPDQTQKQNVAIALSIAKKAKEKAKK